MAQSVRKALETYFEAARQRFSSEGKPSRLWRSPVPGRDNAVSARHRTDYWAAARRIVNALHNAPEFQALIETIVSDPALEDSPEAHKAREYWGPPGSHPAGRSTGRAQDFIDGFVTIPLVQYLETGEAVGYDSDEVRLILDRLVADIKAPRWVVRRTVPLTNLHVVDGPHGIAPGVVVRAASARDQEGWINGDDTAQWRGEASLDDVDLLRIEAVADVTVETERTIPALRDDPDAAMDRLLSALRLATGARVDAPFWEERVAGSASVARPVWVRPVELHPPEQGLFDPVTAQSAASLWPKMRSAGDSTTTGIAIRRFNYAATRNRADDRLLDYWIALESLFTSDSNVELKFRASYRIGIYLGESPEERVAIYELMRKSYDRRSKVVHGSRLKASETPTEEIADRTGDVVRRALLKVLTDEHFKPDNIEVQLLGGELDKEYL